MEESKENELAIAKRIQTFVKTGSVEEAINSVSNNLTEKIEENSTLSGKEEKKVNKKIKSIWSNYRNNILSKMDLENYKKFCELEIERAKTDIELTKMRNEKELIELEHWLKKNKGNLEEIKYNSESKPSMFWYKLNRGVHYLKKTCSNIPKITWFTLAGVCGLALIFLISWGLSKIV